MIDVLMIALQFAPVQSTGAFRSIEFAKRLPGHGIRPTVLTIDPEQAGVIFNGRYDATLVEGLPSEVDIRYLRETRAPVPEIPLSRLWRMLSTLDDTFERRFAPSLIDMLVDLQRGLRQFSAVYASAPPFGAAMLGARAARVLGVPYVLDMRDAWAQWSPGPQISRLHFARKHHDEARAFAGAKTIVGVTPELTELFAGSHPEISRTRFRTITNGVGGIDDLPEVAVWDGTHETIDIGYVGSFYWSPRKPASLRALHRYIHYDPGTEDWSYRSPLPFFRAWAALDRLEPEVGSRLRFHHVGHTPEWLMPMAAEHGLSDRCICHGLMPRHDVRAFMARMTGLLSTSMKRIGGNDYCLASKSFEYLSSGKMVLAFVCPGAQKRFFEEVGGALLFDPDDPTGAASELQSLAGQRRSLPIYRGELQAYDLDRTATQMATLLKCTASHATSVVGSAAS